MAIATSSARWHPALRSPAASTAMSRRSCARPSRSWSRRPGSSGNRNGLAFPPVASPKSLAGDPRIAALRACARLDEQTTRKAGRCWSCCAWTASSSPTARAVRYHRRQGRNCEAVRMTPLRRWQVDPASYPRPGHRGAADGRDQRGDFRARARSPFAHPGELSRRSCRDLSRRPFVGGCCLRCCARMSGKCSTRSTARPLYKALAPIETVVTGADGRVLAATDPNRIATFSELPAEYLVAVRPRGRDDRRGQADRLCPPRTPLSGTADRDDPRHIRRVAPVCRAARDSCHAARDQRDPRRPLCAWAVSCWCAA